MGLRVEHLDTDLLTQGSQDLQVQYAMAGEEPRFEELYLEVGTGEDLQRQGPLGEYNPRSFTAYGLGWTSAGEQVILDADSP